MYGLPLILAPRALGAVSKHGHARSGEYNKIFLNAPPPQTFLPPGTDLYINLLRGNCVQVLITCGIESDYPSIVRVSNRTLGPKLG
jgi:hypothetical protein